MFADPFSGQRMHHFRRYVTERLQDEAAFRETRVRNDNRFPVNYTVTIEQKIQINAAWSLRDCPNAPERFIFNLKHSAQQGTGVKPCRETKYRIVKGIL